MTESLPGLGQITARERQAYDAGRAYQRTEPASPPVGQKAWTAGAVTGGGIGAASIANIIGWWWPVAEPVAADFAAVIVAAGSVVTAALVAWWDGR
jgi:hypothetical protein